ncbi:sensor histidine kinase [Scatolibacter rhodanostii]|uniref:sensor histidine kinase n=1 Tax=Scatolibacter rhodanostii TaxID=2014781 RepID=UPI000C06DF77|nr:ATP-binding protein [Scatolibacter rhodanostii]
MKKKIFLFNSLICALSAFLITLLASFFIYSHDSAELKKSLSSEASHLKTGLESIGNSYLDKVVLRSGHRITLISAKGDVIFDSEVLSSLESHADRQEVKEATQDGIGEELRFSQTMDRRTYYFAVRLENHDVIRVSASAPSVIRSFASLWWVLCLGLLILIPLSWFYARVLTKKITQPLNDLQFENMDTTGLFEELSPFAVKMQKEKKAVRKKLKKLKHKQIEFSAITEYMREGFLVLDKQANILSHNKSALILLDSDFPDAINRSILELNRSQMLTNAVRDALNGKPQEFILVVGEKHCQIFANPVWYKNRSQGAVIVILDVTEKQERERFRREFTANVSHELRTPLTSISGYAEIIANGVAKIEDTPKFAANIYKEAQHMIALIGDILLLSKLDENHSSLVKENVDLKALCKEVIGRLKNKAEKKNIEVAFQGDEAFLNGIPAVLDEIVFNVVDNAVKYNVDNGKINILLENFTSEIKLTVTDTGVGIPLAEQDRVFERFYRVDKSRESSAQSTGLGLSIVKHGVALHNGKIDLKSDGKTGTTVTITFSL